MATCAGIGYFPLAPGTVGSLLAVGLVAALARLPMAVPGLRAELAAAAAVIFGLGVWAAGRAEESFGRTDPGEVVIDEVVGQIVTFLGRPQVSWRWLLAGFLLFRLFDVIKPFPARRAEKLHGGWGIMLDDVAAGVYSLAALWLLELKFG